MNLMSKIYIWLTSSLSFFGCTILLIGALSSPQAHADFGELDIAVRESIEAHFRDYGLAVDMSRFSYVGNAKYIGKKIVVSSSVWAEQRMTSAGWGWQDCETTLEKSYKGFYLDLGTRCQFSFD